MHSHPYAKTEAEINTWLKNMDECNVAENHDPHHEHGKGIRRYLREIFEISRAASKSGAASISMATTSPDSARAAAKELERCRKKGSSRHRRNSRQRAGPALRQVECTRNAPDDARVDAIWEKAGELRMPVSLHVADPIWMYQPMDKHNDGLMNAFEWRLDNQPNIVKLSGMVDILERTASRHRNTTFVACHFANLDYDLNHLGEVFDRNPNLYADISARYAETAPIPRFAAQFYAKYAGRLVYGTDMGFDSKMYRITFRILESQDEHFYEPEQFSYHWPLYGLGLSDDVLKQVYQETPQNSWPPVKPD